MSKAVPSTVSKRARLVYAALGAVFIIVVWQILSMVMDPNIMASPVATVKALGHLASTRVLWVQLLITLRRLVIGLVIGAVLGFVFGVIAGLQPRARSFFEPIRWVGMTMPAVVLAVLVILWFGGFGDGPVIFLVVLVVLPGMYINTSAGVLAIDAKLVEMGRVYHFPRRLLLREVYLPGISSPVMAGLTLATGIAMRAVILGEVLVAASGIGHSILRAESFLNTAEVYAWVVVLLALMALLEFGALRPLKRRTTRWRKGETG
jgi:NitT/TauT family transport system permease protein